MSRDPGAERLASQGSGRLLTGRLGDTATRERVLAMAVVMAVAGIAATDGSILPHAAGAVARSTRFVAFLAMTLALCGVVVPRAASDVNAPARWWLAIWASVAIAILAMAIPFLDARGIVASSALATLVGAACEEIVFRVELPRVLLVLGRSPSRIRSIVLAQVAFVLTHLAVGRSNPPGALAEAEWLFAIGSACAALYVALGLVPAAVAHALYNLLDPQWLTGGGHSTALRSAVIAAASLLVVAVSLRLRSDELATRAT